MTKKDEVYRYIIEYVTENINAPSMRQIMEETGIRSTGSVFDILRKLEKEGKIKITDGASRGITLLGYKVVKE